MLRMPQALFDRSSRREIWLEVGVRRWGLEAMLSSSYYSLSLSNRTPTSVTSPPVLAALLLARLRPPAVAANLLVARSLPPRRYASLRPACCGWCSYGVIYLWTWLSVRCSTLSEEVRLEDWKVTCISPSLRLMLLARALGGDGASASFRNKHPTTGKTRQSQSFYGLIWVSALMPYSGCLDSSHTSFSRGALAVGLDKEHWSATRAATAV